MKKKFATILFITAVAISVTSCKDKAKEATTTAAEAVEETLNSEVYVVNNDASTIEWKGYKPTGSHNGTIAIERGVLDVAGGKIVGGSFIIDMNSIVVTDIPADDKGNAKLVGHLKNADFFDVEKYPSAGFTITGLEEVEGKMMLSGNLSLKEAKNNVTFPVTVTNDNSGITLTSETFAIDRTKWNVQYGSKSIFDNLGDKFINDDMELKVTIKAAAKS
ncbi:YceI family protein [Algibacter sp. R77976]|uniref:YceI family protein n=1 Tax=Algibacter sp. R77976 TaxID=3093873 RepID=UPI0037C970E3